MARYLIVKVETDKAFVAIRRALHDFSKETGEKLSDVGTNMLPAEDAEYIEQAYDKAFCRAKREVRLRGKSDEK